MDTMKFYLGSTKNPPNTQYITTSGIAASIARSGFSHIIAWAKTVIGKANMQKQKHFFKCYHVMLTMFVRVLKKYCTIVC